ncbi:MAG: A/G-specific adenine glycosylase [Bacteroidia bacterium]
MIEVQSIISWFRENGRKMDWRETRNPYAIWIAEVVFQQTRIEQGIGHYHRFMERFPEVEVLAEAEQDEVLKFWEGLGYYSRARNLHAAAKQLVNDYGGKFPETYSELLNLKGVGDYTSRAIASFAFGEKVGVLDGNVLRVLARYWGVEAPVNTPAVRKQLQAQIDVWAAETDSRALNHALMDLGSMICTPSKPGCLLCPLVEGCVARAKGLTAELPIKLKSKRQPPRYANFYLAYNDAGQLAIRQRPAKGLWGGLWEIPNEEIPESAWQEKASPAGMNYRHSLKHVFSHFDLHIQVYEGKVNTLEADNALVFIETDKISTFAFSRAVLRIFEWQNLV